MKWKEFDSQICSTKRSLSVIGDKWTLAIVREAFLGANRFTDFQRSLGIPKHRLSDRLSHLVTEKILEKQGQQRRQTYALTQKGRDLLPVLLAMAQWGDKYMDDGDGIPLKHFHKSCGKELKPLDVCHHCGDQITPESYAIKPGPGIQQKLARGEYIDELSIINEYQSREKTS